MSLSLQTLRIFISSIFLGLIILHAPPAFANSQSKSKYDRAAASLEAMRRITIVLSADPYAGDKQKDTKYDYYVNVTDFSGWKMMEKEDLINHLMDNGGTKKGYFTPIDLSDVFDDVLRFGDNSEFDAILDVLEKNNVNLESDTTFGRTTVPSYLCSVMNRVVIEDANERKAQYALEQVAAKLAKDPRDLRCYGQSLLDMVQASISETEADLKSENPFPTSQDFLKTLQDKHARLEQKYFAKVDAGQIAKANTDPNLKMNSETHIVDGVQIVIDGNQLSAACKAEVIKNLMDQAVGRFKKSGSSETLELFNLNEKKSSPNSHCVGKMRLMRVNAGTGTNKEGAKGKAHTRPAVAPQSPAKSSR